MSTTTNRIGTGGGRWGMRADVLRHGDGHDGSRVGYVELFFDLVFVFAVTQLSHSLIAHPDLADARRTRWCSAGRCGGCGSTPRG